MKNLVIIPSQLAETGSLEQTVPSYQCTAIADMVQKQELSIHYTATLLDTEVLVRGEITGKVTFECCRCLEHFEQPVSLKFDQAYPANTQEIDLADEVRQLLILEMPAKPLCHEECRGICPQCGKNRNTSPCTCAVDFSDPRWDKLRTIVKKK